MDNRSFLEYRNPGLVLIFAILTCGIYLIYWYYRVYQEIQWLTGKTPTGYDFILDLVIMIITCGIWAIYVDYMISVRLKEVNAGLGRVSDTTILVLILDAAAYFNLLTFAISSAIQQDELNKLKDVTGPGQGGSIASGQADPRVDPPSNPYGS